MADIMIICNGVIHWDLTFTHPIQDWELDSRTPLMGLLYATKRVDSGEDTIRWGLHKSKCFTVSSYYRALAGTSTRPFPWKIIWKS